MPGDYVGIMSEQCRDILAMPRQELCHRIYLFISAGFHQTRQTFSRTMGALAGQL